MLRRSVNVLAKAVKSSPWQGSDGIITEGSNTSNNDDGVGFKGPFRPYEPRSRKELSLRWPQPFSSEACTRHSSATHRTTVSAFSSTAMLTSRYVSSSPGPGIFVSDDGGGCAVQCAAGPRGEWQHVLGELAWTSAGVHDLGPARVLGRVHECHLGQLSFLCELSRV